MIYIWYPILLLSVLSCIVAEESIIANKTVAKILSRRKRFLIFPDGSSFQLVLCTQNHGYLQIGNVVTFGNTAALAWELPTDPNLFYLYKDQSKLYDAKRRNDVIYYLDEDGKVIDKKDYKRKIIVNPAFAKRSIDTTKDTNTVVKNMLKKEMHNKQKNLNHLKELDAKEIDFHRKGRQKLYVKLEKFLQTLGWNGKECVLQMLCQASKLDKADQGTFFDEILRAVFTLPKLHVQSEVHNRYDDAHGANGDCAHLYPNCEHSPLT